ncbi:Type II restriction modification system N6-adenine DNA methyltransferase [Metamycoplasma auris 15026]|uniref:Site-specific DNA-methyltransferase (adenine-specific) n=1 Tax=Metamycoplasma auris 15026 TaxID=1188233 RepID=N9VB21_9BACT|nr:Dam family site-specific DNA-(adenine-N6)-methyltransferase [Metamycoplasma auris]ENY68878.1 Type II restriction modification system N6-adenine DNA methyltransferase [Metamycoplasma auris 15026]
MEKELLLSFGNRIKFLREKRNLSQDMLSNICNFKREYLSRIEKGKANVTLGTAYKLANAFSVEISYLFASNANIKPKPFVKWAGGKNQIIDKLKDFLPKEFNRYYEPFVGGGALLFYLKPNKAIINDSNKELIYAYQSFLDEAKFYKLIKELECHEVKHCEEYYYQIRNWDRDANFKNLKDYKRAARLIYLNKACFNGLYRVNSSGFYNTPFGNKEKINTFDKNNFLDIYKYFSNAIIEIKNEDFEQSVKDAKKDDFVYFDPPYDVYENKSSFTSYNSKKFGKEEQIRLRDLIIKLSKKGVKVMISNSNTPFINELYRNFNKHIVQAKRIINSDAKKRGYIEELIITNY